MTTLDIKDLHVSVENPSDGGEIAILNGVNLTVSSGETHAVMGPNGSGNPPCPTRSPGTRNTV